MVTTKQRYTLADLFDLPDDGQIHELLGGELVVRNAPDSNHALVVAELVDYLMAAQDAGYGLAFAGPYAAAFDYSRAGNAAKDVTHPDLLFVLRARETIIADRFVEGVPDLVIEVLSPTNQGRDTVEKLEIHRRNGLPNYWIVDTRSRTIHQYALIGAPYQENGRYDAPVILGGGDRLTCPLFSGVSVPVARVFRNVRERARRAEPETSSEADRD